MELKRHFDGNGEKLQENYRRPLKDTSREKLERGSGESWRYSIWDFERDFDGTGEGI